MRIVTILAHTGVVTSLAGLFFGILAWTYHSPYGLPMSLGSAILLIVSGAFGWYYGFSPLWRPRGWEQKVEHAGQAFIVSTQPYPPYLSFNAKRNNGARFGTAVYPLQGEEVAEDVRALYGMQWRERQEAEEGHRWIVQVLHEGRFAELEEFRIGAEQL